MKRFLARHQAVITGTLSGYDRILFRGIFRGLSHAKGLDAFLGSQGVLLKDFGTFAEQQSGLIKAHAEEVARAAGRPLIYLPSAHEAKEDLVRRIAAHDQIREGLICVLTCVEPCRSYTIRRDAQARLLRLVKADRKCLFVYFYYLDREFGVMHVRLQTWFPFDIQVCLNGREWLARRLDKAGLAYERCDNGFLALADPARAQHLADRFLRYRWPPLLDAVARRCNPLLRRGRALAEQHLYWTVRQAEYATDVMFRDAASLAAVYPALVQHAIRCFSAEDILRFLAQKLHPNFQGEVTSKTSRRPEGVRIRHQVQENWLKMYDKAGRLLRIETTINNPRRFRVYRRAVRQGQRCWAWLPMRKGIADLWRRTQLCRAANARYLDALAVVGDAEPSAQVLDPVSQPVLAGPARFRPLRPVSPEDGTRFQAVLAGPHLVHGFRNADLRARLFPDVPASSEVQQRLSGQVTRLLRLLRAHQLIQRVPHTTLYRITPRGHKVMGTALTFRQTPISVLKHAA